MVVDEDTTSMKEVSSVTSSYYDDVEEWEPWLEEQNAYDSKANLMFVMRFTKYNESENVSSIECYLNSNDSVVRVHDVVYDTKRYVYVRVEDDSTPSSFYQEYSASGDTYVSESNPAKIVFSKGTHHTSTYDWTTHSLTSDDGYIYIYDENDEYVVKSVSHNFEDYETPEVEEFEYDEHRNMVATYKATGQDKILYREYDNEYGINDELLCCEYSYYHGDAQNKSSRTEYQYMDLEFNPFKTLEVGYWISENKKEDRSIWIFSSNGYFVQADLNHQINLPIIRTWGNYDLDAETETGIMTLHGYDYKTGESITDTMNVVLNGNEMDIDQVKFVRFG